MISDGVNNKAGSFFAPYEFFYVWRKIEGMVKEVDGIDSMYTLVQGMFDKNRLRDIIRNFIYLPDSSKKDEKILCRYPQYYGANKLFQSIIEHQKPEGDGKGGTYFGATGCGKSFTMLFLTRLLMRSKLFSSPTIVLITDRTDLDDQLAGQFTNAKEYIGDNNVISVESREELRERLQGIQSGGVYLTTIHKFTEDTELLTDRSNAAEFAQLTQDLEKRFMFLVKRMKAAYDICAGSDKLNQAERDWIHFYLAVRSIVFKLTKGTAPDTAQMNARVLEMIKEALSSDGVEEIFKLNDDKNAKTNIFDDDYLAKIEKIKLPNTKIKLLQQLLAKAIEEFKKVNRVQGVDFSKKMQSLVEKYNERKEGDVLRSKVLEDFTDEIIDLYHALKKEKESFNELG